MNFGELSISHGEDDLKMFRCPVCYEWVRDCAWHLCLSPLQLPPPRRAPPPPPPNTETKNNSGEKKPRKKQIPKGALEILRDLNSKNEVKTEEDPVPERKTEEPKTEKVKKKPKTHFRKSKKPGRA